MTQHTPTPPASLTGGPGKSTPKAARAREGKRGPMMAIAAWELMNLMASNRNADKGDLLRFALESVATPDELAQWEVIKSRYGYVESGTATKDPTTPAPSPEPVL